MWVQSPGGEDPVEEGMTTHPECLPEESYGQKSLAGHSPQSQTRPSDLAHTQTLRHTGSKSHIK